MDGRTYIAIDLKSFYASVECVERGFDPLTTNLVVADASRTEKTICLAVSPSLKALGVPGRPRLFEVTQKVVQINEARRQAAPGKKFNGVSFFERELAAYPSFELGFFIAPPQMAHYVQRSTEIYEIYLKYLSPDDIHVYSIDEIFADVTAYLKTYGLSALELTRKLLREVLEKTGITATAGIGSNLFLAKVAMDVEAKHIAPDAHGARIATLDEASFRRSLWTHKPLTDIWRIGRGIARKLEAHGMFTLGDVARCSLENEDLLYRLFGINAELLIDHAWGWEPCTIADVKAFTPQAQSVGSGQVLPRPYAWGEAALVAREMADSLALDLVARGLVADKLALCVHYDVQSLAGATARQAYKGEITTDAYGRAVPKRVQGGENLPRATSSSRLLRQATATLFERLVDPGLLVRNIALSATHVVPEGVAAQPTTEQLSLFTDVAAEDARRAEEEAALERETRAQKAVLAIREKFGRNAILKGMNLEHGATATERNQQIGGHRA